MRKTVPALLPPSGQIQPTRNEENRLNISCKLNNLNEISKPNLGEK